jgi:tetratricopeptide (TPR) repeat protein
MKSAFGAVLVLFSALAFGQELSEIAMPPNGDNERAEVSQWIGPVQISIEYHSPHVHNPPDKDRTGHIWGELVHYGFYDEGFGPTKGAPWRAGANESTTISFSHDVSIDGKELKAGKYALFLDVEQSGPWNWVFSRHIGWGSYQYDPKDDALRVAVTPQDASFTEDLTYGFADRGPSSAVAFLQWEKKRIPFKVEVHDVNGLYVAKMREQLQSWAGFQYQDWQNAAQFCADNKTNLEEALTWADKAISSPFRGATVGQRDFSTLMTKASVLEAMGRTPDADNVMDEAMRLPGTDSVQFYIYTMRLLRNGRKERALKVAAANKQQHPEEKYWPYLGLARSYAAAGQKKDAIENWEVVLRNIPPDMVSRTATYQETLNKLKDSNQAQTVKQ